MECNNSCNSSCLVRLPKGCRSSWLLDISVTKLFHIYINMNMKVEPGVGDLKEVIEEDVVTVLLSF